MKRLLVFSVFLLLAVSIACSQEKTSPYQGYLDRALEYFQAREYDRAIREISKVLSSKNTEELAAAYYVRGACQRLKGDLQAAAADLEKSLQYKKDWLSPLEILGVVYAADADAAVRAQKGLPPLSRAVVLQSKSSAVYEALARLSVERKNLAEAARWLDSALHWGTEVFSLLENDSGLGVLRDTEYGQRLLSHRKEFQEARTTFQQAVEASNRNEHARALDLLRQCIPGLLASVGPGGAALGEAYFNLGLSHALRGAYAEAVEPYEKALAIRIETQGARSVGAAEIHKCIAAALANAGDAARALARSKEIIAIMVDLFGENDPGTAQACEQAGILLARLGDHAQAISYHERALAIRTRVLGAAHPDTLASMEKIAGVLSERGDHEKAIALGQKALDLRRAAAGGVPTRALADSHEVLALICMRKKDYLKAVSLLTQAIGMRRTVLGDYHEDTARAFEGRAVAYKGLVGKQYLAASREDYLKAYTIRLKVLGPEHADTLAAEKQIGVLYAAEREGKDWMVPYLEVLLQAKATALGADHLALAADYDRLGKEHASRREHPKAIAALTKALSIRRALLGEGDPKTTASWLALGDAQRDALDYAAAITSYRGALGARERASGGGDLLTATCLVRLGEAHGLKGEYDSAIAHLERAYRLSVGIRGERHPVMAPLCESLGRAYQDVGLFSKASEFYSRAFSIWREAFGDRDARTAATRRMLGALDLAMGNVEAAEEQFRHALSIQEEKLGRDHLDTARTTCGLADALLARGDAEKAVSYYTEALEAFRKANGERDPEVATISGYLASAYDALGQSDTSLAYSKKALAIEQAVYGEKGLKTAATCNNIATTYWHRGEYSKAIEFFGKAIVGYLDAVGENHPDTARIFGNIALVYAAGGEYGEARRHGETALRVGRNVFGTEHPAVARFCNTLGLVSYQAGDIPGSIARFSDALAVARRTGIDADVVEYANNLGWAYRDSRDFPKARASFDEAIAAVETARGKLGSGKAEFMARNISSYYSSLALSADLGDAPSFFRTAESLRARGFLDRMSLEAALSAGGIPESQAKEMIALSDEIGNLASRRNTEVRKAEKDRDRAALQKVSRELDEKEKRFAALEGSLLANERFRALRKPRIAQLAEAQALLSATTAILEYVIWEERDRESLAFMQKRSFCMVIRKGGARIVPLDGQFDYGSTIEEFRAAILNAPDRAAKPGSALYAALIGPVEAELQGCNELIIVPDGALAFLPFDALRKTPKDPYLAERWAMTMTPSASVMLMLGGRAQGGDRQRMLGFGGGVYSSEGAATDRGRGKRGSAEKAVTAAAREYAAKRAGKDGAGRYFDNLGIEWANLPGTMQEVKEIGGQVFGGTGVALFTGKDATERTLKDLSAGGELARYRLVHLACHGYYDQVYPSFSSVIFSEVSGLVDSEEDGYLTVEEVAELDLRADLVNLSACETGLGKIVAGDGVTGLARAFQVAGADHVGVTLWEVADDGTKQFMVDVYRKYASGASLRDAFAETKREFIRSADFGDPYYWSPFVLYGN